MLTNVVIAHGNDPHSSTASSELVRQLTCKFEQELCEVVTAIGCEEFTPSGFGSALSDLRAMLASIGRDALTQLLKEQDVASPSIEVDGRRARFRIGCDFCARMIQWHCRQCAAFWCVRYRVITSAPRSASVSHCHERVQ
jgi:hypothetical protein